MHLVAQSCLTLCNPVGYSLPGSSVHGLYQARILEWVAISFSRASSQPRVEPTSLACPALAGGSFTHVSCVPCTGRGILYPRLLRALHRQGDPLPTSPACPALAGGSFTTSATWEARVYVYLLSVSLPITLGISTRSLECPPRTLCSLCRSWAAPWGKSPFQFQHMSKQAQWAWVTALRSRGQLVAEVKRCSQVP